MLYKLYVLSYEKGWVSYTLLYNEEEIMPTIENMDKNKYARVFVVCHDFEKECDIPMFSMDIKEMKKLGRRL